MRFRGAPGMAGITRRSALSVALAAAILTALSVPGAESDDGNGGGHSGRMTVTADSEAVGRVADEYNRLFSNLFFRNDVDGKYYPFPKLRPEDFQVTATDDAGWTVSHQPLTGPTVSARVGRDGALVQFEPVLIALE